MIRLIIFLSFLCALALGAATLADEPGSFKLDLFGHVIETTGFMAIGLFVAAMVVVAAIVWMLRWLWLTPSRTQALMQRRRSKKGHDAVSRGIVAIGAGDLRMAERQADEAERLAPNEPLTLLLRAQASQLAGDRDGAEKAFRSMLDNRDTKVLGLRGLYVEAQRRQDLVALKAIAEEAVRVAPSASWAANALLEHHAMSEHWAEALTCVERNATAGLMTRAQSERYKAVLLAAEALALENENSDKALKLALDANRLAPSLVPAASLAGKLLGAKGDVRKASRLIEAAWEANPHPDLAQVYAHLRNGDSALDRYKRVRHLTTKSFTDPESQMALCRAALDAQAWDEAHAALVPLVAGAATQRTCLLMAELYAKRDNDQARAREWMAKALRAPRDAVWTADGYISEHWLPASPITGKLDAFSWKVPLEQIGGSSLHVDDVLADHYEAPLPVAAPQEPVAEPAVVVLPADEPQEVPYHMPPDDPGPKPEPAKKRSFFSRF